MAGKILAACEARSSSETLIIARTDAIAVEGLQKALERAEAYVEAGADMLFVEAPQSLNDLQLIVKQFSGRVPLMANMVEGGKTPLLNTQGLQDLGFSLVIFPGGIVRAIAATAGDYYRNLLASGSNEAFRDRMFDFSGLNEVLGTEQLLAQGKRFEYIEEREKNNDH